MGGGQAKPNNGAKPKASSFADSERTKSKKLINKNSMLMLGTAGVGKTTIVKQLTMQLGDGMTEDKLVFLRHALRLVCVKRICDIINYSAEEHDDVEPKPGEEKYAQITVPDDCDWVFEKVEEIGTFNMDTAASDAVVALGDDLAKIWALPFVQEIARTREITHDNDVCLAYACADQFLPDVQRMFAADTVLTNAEALQVRAPTSAIEITPFAFQGDKWTVKDVGGQIHHRASWKSAFVGSSVVLYIVSLADYDKFTGVDMKKNLLMESRKLFKELCQTDEMIGKPFVLLFNKEDLFLKKLEKKGFNVCPQFRTIEGRQELFKKEDETYEKYKDRCCEALFAYYQKAYHEACVKAKIIQEGSDAPIEYYATCATDTDFVDNSFNAVFVSILKQLSAQVANSGLV